MREFRNERGKGGDAVQLLPAKQPRKTERDCEAVVSMVEKSEMIRGTERGK